MYGGDCMKRNLLYSIAVSAILLVLYVALCFTVTADTSIVAQQNTIDIPTIIIDPGHGGEDGGASAGENILEKDINLNISLKLRDFLQSNGFDVLMTREIDTAIYDEETSGTKKRSDLNNRVRLFNSSDNNIVVSIHQNKFVDSKYYGMQVFYSDNDEQNKILAENIRNSVVSLLQPDNKRECKLAGSEIYILDNTNVPAVLVECGFLSNETEASMLNTDEYQNKIAYCIYLGIMEYYYTNY